MPRSAQDFHATLEVVSCPPGHIQNRRLVLAVFDQESTRSSLHSGYGPDSSTATENRLDKNLVPTNIAPTLDQGEARGQSRIEGRDQEAEPVRFCGTGGGAQPGADKRSPPVLVCPVLQAARNHRGPVQRPADSARGKGAAALPGNCRPDDHSAS